MSAAAQSRLAELDAAIERSWEQVPIEYRPAGWRMEEPPRNLTEIRQLEVVRLRGTRMNSTAPERVARVLAEVAHANNLTVDALLRGAGIPGLRLARRQMSIELRSMGFSYLQIENWTGFDHATLWYYVNRYSVDRPFDVRRCEFVAIARVAEAKRVGKEN